MQNPKTLFLKVNNINMLQTNFSFFFMKTNFIYCAVNFGLYQAIAFY